MRRAALDAVARGWRVVVLGPREPLWGVIPFDRLGRPDLAAINAWFMHRPKVRLGICLGAQSGCVAVEISYLDADPRTVDLLHDVRAELPQTPTSVIDNEVFTFYFRHLSPNCFVPSMDRIDGIHGLNLLGDYMIVAIPPTYTVRAEPIVWARHPDDVPLAPLPEEFRRVCTPRS